MSRAIGDAPYRRYGLSSMPEQSAALRLVPGDRFLLLASDGLFEVMSPDEACQLALSLADGLCPAL